MEFNIGRIISKHTERQSYTMGGAATNAVLIGIQSNNYMDDSRFMK